MHYRQHDTSYMQISNNYFAIYIIRADAISCHLLTRHTCYIVNTTAIKAVEHNNIPKNHFLSASNTANLTCMLRNSNR